MDANDVLKVRNYIIVTHGLTMRLFAMRYFKWTVDEFVKVWNPDNCAKWVLELDERGKYNISVEHSSPPTYGTTREDSQNRLPVHMTHGISKQGDDLVHLRAGHETLEVDDSGSVHLTSRYDTEASTRT